MAYTITKKWSHGRSWPLLCDYCGVKWPSNKLVRDPDGKLRCPDEGSGAPAGELSRLNAQGAREAFGRNRVDKGPRF